MATDNTVPPEASGSDSQLLMRAEIKDWRASHPRRWGRRSALGLFRLAALGLCIALLFVALGAALNMASDAMHVSSSTTPHQR